MTDPTHTIPASELERIEKEADNHNIVAYSLSREDYKNILIREYLRRERWVSVKERLPEPGEKVIIFSVPLGVRFATRNYHHMQKHKWWTVEPWTKSRTRRVTHWQPLPEPPSEP